MEITDQEWERMAKALEVEKEDVFEEEIKMVFNNHTKNGTNFGYVHAYQCDKIIEAKDQIIKQQQDEIEFLRSLIKKETI